MFILKFHHVFTLFFLFYCFLLFPLLLAKTFFVLKFVFASLSFFFQQRFDIHCVFSCKLFLEHFNQKTRGSHTNELKIVSLLFELKFIKRFQEYTLIWCYLMKLVTGNIKVKFRSHINYIFIKYIFSVKETHYQPNGKNIPGKITSKIYLKFFFPSNI
jgi:hypothetical protein